MKSSLNRHQIKLVALKVIPEQSHALSNVEIKKCSPKSKIIRPNINRILFCVNKLPTQKDQSQVWYCVLSNIRKNV